MRRQRPIRSVLAGRKMFNGGMMMPLDTPPAMQNTPSGILASSQPLIESVTQEVVAPMSMASASAPVPMAQGGVVQGFRKGGLQSRNQYRKSRSKWEPQIDGIGPGLPGTGLENGDSGPYYTTVGERTRLGPGSSPENLIARYEANPGELTNLMFPYDASITGRKKPGDPGYFHKGTSPSKMSPRVGADIIGIPPGEVRAVDLLYKIPQAGLDQLFRGLSQAEAWVTRGLYDFYDASTTPKPEDQNWRKLYDQTFSVNNLLRRLPDIAGVSKDDLATEITGIAKQLVSNDINISGEDIVNAVSEHLRDKYDAPVLEQYDLSQEGGGFSTEKEQADAFLSMEINKLYPNMPDDEVIEIIKAKELNPDSSIEELVRLSYPDEIVAAYATPGNFDTSRPGDPGLDYEGMGGTVVDPNERVSTAADVDAMGFASTHVLTEADIRSVYPKATRKQVKIIMDASKDNPGLPPEQIARLIIGTSDDYHDATTPSDAAAAAAAAGAAVASDDTTAASPAAADATVPPPADGIGPGIFGTGGPSPAAAASPAAAEVISAAVDDDEYGTTKGALGEYLGDEDDIVDLMRGELRQAVGEVRATASNPKKTPAETKRDIKFFMDRFKKAAPEYEGASSQEKALVLLDAGLRIMAGQSPNAITNIANGLKGIGKELAKDAKEKRAYDRQVDLSAAKYALAGVDKEDAKADALAKEGRGLKTVFWTEDVYGPDGKLRGKLGTSGFITNAEIHSGNYDGKFEAGLTLATERLKNKVKGNADLFRKMLGQTKKGGISDDFFDKKLKAYTASSLKLSDYATQLALVDVSAAINEAGEATGLGSYVSRRVNNFYNTFNMGRPGDQLTSIKQITTKDIDALNVSDARKTRLKSIKSGYTLLDKYAEQGRRSEQFLAQQQELANLLIKEILGEGSKNVSNIDRQLAAEIVGLYSGLSSITADKVIIGQRLGRIRQRILKNYESENNSMSATEGYFSDIVDRSLRNVRETYFMPVRRSALGQVESALGQPKTSRPGFKSPYTFKIVDGKRRYSFK